MPDLRGSIPHLPINEYPASEYCNHCAWMQRHVSSTRWISAIHLLSIFLAQLSKELFSKLFFFAPFLVLVWVFSSILDGERTGT
jgi:hypothetical protein